MNQVTFVTGNARKIWQAETILKNFDISVRPVSLDIDEIQSHDPRKIGAAKAEAAHGLLKRPLVVNDHYWSIPALNGFPGGYMKDMNMWFSPEDFLALMEGKNDRSAELTECVIYYDGQKLKHFEAKFRGEIIKEPRGMGHVPCERIVVFDGSNKTIAEHIDDGEHAREAEKSAWNLFGEWYAKQ